MKEYTVYWYRRPEYTNPYTQGYIGITKNMKKRNQQHLSSKVVTHFTNALKAYQDITYVQVANERFLFNDPGRYGYVNLKYSF